MARAKLGSENLADGYERDARRLLTWFTRRTTDAQLAVDLVAETYARAFASRRRFRGDPADPDAVAAWTWGIAHNVLHDALRRGGAERTDLAVTRVRFRRLEQAEVDWYLGTGEWRERAGGYAIQGKGAALVEALDGDYLNVVGLPVPALLRLAPDLVFAGSS